MFLRFDEDGYFLNKLSKAPFLFLKFIFLNLPYHPLLRRFFIFILMKFMKSIYKLLTANYFALNFFDLLLNCIKDKGIYQD
jgi:hypothetical protein